MIVSSDSVQGVYDLCIVGAGPAGIILALEFAKQAPKKRVLLVEFGNGKRGKNRLDQSIINRNPKNHFDPYECTNKGLGGTSATWGGRCVMYDAIDFMPHGLVDVSTCTWSSNFLNAVTPFVDTACDYFHCGSGGFDLRHNQQGFPPIAENFVEGDVTSTVLERWSLPTRFGKFYYRKLVDSPSIHLLQDFEGRDFAVGENRTLSTLRLISVNSDRELAVQARQFVLANGGQEATRTLLRNPSVFERGMTPHALGRYYQGHISGKVANVKFFGNPDRTDYGYIKTGDAALCRRRFQFTPQLIEREGLLNTAFWLDNLPVYDPRHGSGVLSMIYLIMIMPFVKNRLLHAAMIRTLTNDKVADIKGHLFNVVRSLPTSIYKTAEICLKRYLPQRKLPGVHLKSRDNRYALHFHAEQVPRPENRMRLADDGETLIIDYSYSDEEIDRCIRAHEILDEVLQLLNCGHLEYYHAKDKLREAIRDYSKDGLHQIGTTRVGTSAENGVVDTDLKVFGATNLYVCASSVFPTSGQANPTFFLGACAVRLAGHLSRLESDK